MNLDNFLGGQKLLGKQLWWDGFTDQIALKCIATKLLQNLALGFGFDTLGHCAHTKVFGQGDNTGNNGTIVGIRLNIRDKMNDQFSVHQLAAS